MPAIEIRGGIYQVGAQDPMVRSFHGYKTPYGSTYNAYLIADEEITLIDSVKAPFTGELLENISQVTEPSRIGRIIVNHVEPDHSGALPKLFELCKNARIYATANGLKGLRAYYGELPEIQTVKAGDTIKTGRYTFRFLPMPMVHWPDSMSTYLEEERILFSNDAFGQHIASDAHFDDELGLDKLLERAGDYYANIVLPFGQQVRKLLGEAQALPGISMICPSHGVVLRGFIGQLVEKYTYWSSGQSDEKKAVVVYDTMWGATAQLAQRIAAQFADRGVLSVLLPLDTTHVSTAMAELLEAKYVCVGSPTLNRGVMPNVAAFLSYMRGLNPRDRVGLAFGAYGWSGESVGIIEETFRALGFALEPSVKVQWRP